MKSKFNRVVLVVWEAILELKDVKTGEQLEEWKTDLLQRVEYIWGHPM